MNTNDTNDLISHTGGCDFSTGGSKFHVTHLRKTLDMLRAGV